VSGLWDRDRIVLRRMPLSGGLGQPLDPPVEFGALAAIGDFDLASDGSLLVFTFVEARGDVWVLESDVGSF
jgi:hypothetical protein